MAEVNLLNVCKQIGAHAVLDSVSLDIHDGEFIVVVGPSGCGKSTLLRLIAGLDTLSSGSILVNSRCVNSISPAERNMAMVFQNYALYPHMTVFDNMAYGLKMRKVKKPEIQARVNEVATLLRLTPYLSRKPSELSGGQRQRVAMGRAIVRNPDVFLFDEPLSNLDAQLRANMRHEIRRLHQQLRTTSLYVTHDQTEAMTMAERILVLNKGVVEQVGTSNELYQRPETLFVAGFTGHYPLNEFDGVYDKAANKIHTSLGVSFDAPAGLHDKIPVILAIRPEHIKYCKDKKHESIALKIEFIDDLGADKLIQAINADSGLRLNVRLSAEQELVGNTLYIELPKNKVHMFHHETKKRIGEWDDRS
jgi:sn-glycerol 3-phosphate transport system ATP-binding protein